MDIDDIIGFTTALDAVIAQRPLPGDGTPEVSWGDVFFHYAPAGTIPAAQPFATIITKDYPDEPTSGLDAPGRFRLNIATPRSIFTRVIGLSPREAARTSYDARIVDAWFPHPVYGAAGWLSIVNPDTRSDQAQQLIVAAYQAARDRQTRRTPSRIGE